MDCSICLYVPSKCLPAIQHPEKAESSSKSGTVLPCWVAFNCLLTFSELLFFHL